MLGTLNVIVCRLDKAKENVFNVLANVACLGKGGGICNSKGNLEALCQGLGNICLTYTGRTEEKHVGLLNLNAVVFGIAFRLCFLALLGSLLKGENSLIVVIHRYRESKLCLLLTDNVLVEHSLDFLGAGKSLKGELVSLGFICLKALYMLLDEVGAKVNAVVANICLAIH